MGKDVLFIDDEELIREIFSDAFSASGYTVKLASTAEEALEMLRYDFCQVIFSDLNLPGMNGIELCKRVRKDRPTAILHALTGYASLFELIDCREAGFDDYFIKPMKIDQLLKATEQAFERIERWKRR